MTDQTEPDQSHSDPPTQESELDLNWIIFEYSSRWCMTGIQYAIIREEALTEIKQQSKSCNV